MLKIGLENIKCLSYHGVLDAERANGNNFIVNIHVWYKTKTEFEKDLLEETYDYSLLSNIVKEEMAVSVYLLENVAYRIINRVASTDKKIKKVYIKIQKPNPPLKGDIQYSFVEIKKKVNR
ncbi:MAG: dihydroneopterin aldolase [Chitinophagales bacterium]